MDIKEIRNKSKKELQSLLLENQGKLRDLKFKIFQKQQKNLREIRTVKKTIARIMTVIKEGGKNNKKTNQNE
ncbi:50S ribosomal protein L29 [Candidatus Parcubacteria bacterium]|nr:MAG: 50S ribosomal protein L29 [Candidatus Parcubacteria bacterium]